MCCLFLNYFIVLRLFSYLNADYNTCWSEMKASKTCSKYKGCLDKCMSNETCPEECNIAKILGKSDILQHSVFQPPWSR